MFIICWNCPNFRHLKLGIISIFPYFWIDITTILLCFYLPNHPTVRQRRARGGRRIGRPSQLNGLSMPFAPCCRWCSNPRLHHPGVSCCSGEDYPELSCVWSRPSTRQWIVHHPSATEFFVTISTGRRFCIDAAKAVPTTLAHESWEGDFNSFNLKSIQSAAWIYSGGIIRNDILSRQLTIEQIDKSTRLVRLLKMPKTVCLWIR